MQTKFWASFDAGGVHGGLAAIVDPIGCADTVIKVDEWDFQDIHKINVDIEMNDGDPRISPLLEALRSHGTFALHGRRDIYTEDELQSAPLLHMWMTDAYEVLGGQVFRETTYDLSNACSNCGTGARQTSPLYIAAKDVKKIKGHAVSETPYADLFVKEKIIARLRDAGITNFSLREVYSLRKDGGTTLLPRKQIIPNHTMPPMHPRTNLDLKYACKSCYRGGLSSKSGESFRIHYRSVDLANVADFNFTWEWLGMAHFNWPVSGLRFAHPDILVTPKVMNILRESVAEDAFHWTPIWVVEE